MHTRRFVLVGAASVLAASSALARRMKEVSGPDGVQRADIGEPVFPRQDPIAEWFNSAKSAKGESCCGTADGFKLGFTYEVYEKGIIAKRLMLKDFYRKQESYWAHVYDTVTHAYVVLPAEDYKRVNKNPTGHVVVWLVHEDNVCKVRCWAPVSES